MDNRLRFALVAAPLNSLAVLCIHTPAVCGEAVILYSLMRREILNMPRHEECAKAQPQPLSESEIAAAIWQSEAAQCRVNAPPAVVITGLVTPGVVVRAGDKSARFVVEFPPAETTVLQTTPPEACPPGQPSVTPEQAAASGCPTQVTPEQAVVQPTTTQVTPEQAAVQPATTQVAPEQAVVQPTTTQQSTLVQVSPVQPCDQPPPPFHRHFHGLNLGLIKIGIDDRGSFAFGCNVGIAKVDTRIGRLTGVDAGAGLGPIGANGGVGVNFETDGIHGHVNADQAQRMQSEVASDLARKSDQKPDSTLWSTPK